MNTEARLTRSRARALGATPSAGPFTAPVSKTRGRAATTAKKAANEALDRHVLDDITNAEPDVVDDFMPPTTKNLEEELEAAQSPKAEQFEAAATIDEPELLAPAETVENLGNAEEPLTRTQRLETDFDEEVFAPAESNAVTKAHEEAATENLLEAAPEIEEINHYYSEPQTVSELLEGYDEEISEDDYEPEASLATVRSDAEQAPDVVATVVDSTLTQEHTPDAVMDEVVPEGVQDAVSDVEEVVDYGSPALSISRRDSTGMDDYDMQPEVLPAVKSVVVVPSPYDGRSMRQIKKQIKDLKASKQQLPGLDNSETDESSAPSLEDTLAEEDELCSALDSLAIEAHANLLGGLPAAQGKHIRFDDNGTAVPSPSNGKVLLRGVPAPTGTRISFSDEDTE